MKGLLRLRHVIIAGAVALIGSAAFALSQLTDKDVPPQESYAYVALGDSYSAGNGTPHAKGICHRSDQAYPALWAQRLHDDERFKFAACSGADTFDVRREQVDHLGKDTRLVTVTIGGNDGQSFAAVVSACALTESQLACDEAADTASVFVHKHLPGRLAATYREIQRRAPLAQLVVLGYPIPYAGTQCTQDGPPVRIQGRVNLYAEELNATIRKAAQEAEAAFVPVLFQDHELCMDEPWLHGLLADRKSAFHPTETGHRSGYLAALEADVPGLPAV